VRVLGFVLGVGVFCGVVWSGWCYGILLCWVFGLCVLGFGCGFCDCCGMGCLIWVCCGLVGCFCFVFGCLGCVVYGWDMGLSRCG
jgi:hypothetical protein